MSVASKRLQHLQAFLGQNTDAPGRVHGAGYKRPNPDGSRKKCSNCMFWVMPHTECHLHGIDTIITDDMSCGHHIYGTPQSKSPERVGIQTMLPEDSGLVQLRGGTSCDLCSHYRPTPGQPSGVCSARYEHEPPYAHPVVQALARCASWNPSD